MQNNMPQFPNSYWLDLELPSFPKLEEEKIHTDVGIVGGGITGLTAAYLLSKQNIKVTLIDASTLANGTTGHTTAKITAQHELIYDELIQHFGVEKASRYYQAEIEAKNLIQQTVETLEIDCSFKKQDAYIFTNSDEYVTKLETEKKAYDQLNISSELTENIPLDLNIKRALMMKDQAQFHPIAYLRTLIKECEKNGVQFYENTTAVDIEYNNNPAIVTRNEKRIICKNVIVASHFPFYDKQSFYFSRMYPERSYIIAVKSDKKYPGGMYINAESPTRSIRSTDYNGEELWLIGGENHKTGQGKSTIKHYEALQQYATDHFTIEKFLYRWSAQDLTTLDKLPYIGPITDGQDNVFIATGYRKWGMTNGTVAAKIIADQIVHGKSDYDDLFSPSRFQADPMIKKFARINADVAKHMIKGKLTFTNDTLKDLATDDATITRIGATRAGVYKDKNDHIHALDTTCTHMGCEVEWNSGDRTWDCPCHGSRFSYKGEVLEGPAKEPLKQIEIPD